MNFLHKKSSKESKKVMSNKRLTVNNPIFPTPVLPDTAYLESVLQYPRAGHQQAPSSCPADQSTSSLKLNLEDDIYNQRIKRSRSSFLFLLTIAFSGAHRRPDGRTDGLTKHLTESRIRD